MPELCQTGAQRVAAQQVAKRLVVAVHGRADDLVEATLSPQLVARRSADKTLRPAGRRAQHEKPCFVETASCVGEPTAIFTLRGAHTTSTDIDSTDILQIPAQEGIFEPLDANGGDFPNAGARVFQYG